MQNEQEIEMYDLHPINTESTGCDNDDANEEGVMKVKSVNQAGRAAWGQDANAGLPNNFIKTSKYEWWNFVFLNLWLQFHKIANLYFLANMCFALIPGVSPVFPVTTITPLVAVVGVAAVRDAYEDWKRHRQDNKANSVSTNVLREGNEFTTVKSCDVRAGDIVQIFNNSEIPADILLLSSKRDDGGCYLETANLDGESNLKSKTALSATSKITDPASLQQIPIALKCDPPSMKLSAWNGTASWNGAQHPAGLDNLLLRGCVLRETPCLYGFVVYTGVNTKMFLNLTPPPNKKSRIDQKLERLILGILGCQQIVILILCGVSLNFAKNSSQSTAFYIKHFNDEHSPFVYFVVHYLTYFVLLSLMMPISLFLSIEFCKTLQAQFMEWDIRMYDDERQLSMKAQTASLNEELSQIQVICTDKTGTLTDNKMVFAKASCMGLTYDELANEGSMVSAIQEGNTDTARMLELFAVCNTVIPSFDDNDGSLHYAGDSTDEVALVKAANRNGFKLREKKEDYVLIETPSCEIRIEILCTLPFSSDRKMMSVVARHPSDGLLLYNKGADASVLSNLGEQTLQEVQVKRKIEDALDGYACGGLRTLCVSTRRLSESTYESWRKDHWEPAVTAVKDRDVHIENACLKLETNLTLLGATGIEDKLQDKVPETISYFRSAGVVIFVLTGDKRETAINIAKSCTLIKQNTKTIVLDVSRCGSQAPEKYLADLIEETIQCTEELGVDPWGSPTSCGTPSFSKSGDASSDSEPNEVCIVVDGATFAVIHEHCLERFKSLALKVSTALCCRVTPMQKADIVKLIQDQDRTCLGVGDGANDVSMIQRAKVGVGIMGLEGSQAERSSDYSIPRFKHLVPLLAIHGRYSLLKNSYLIQYSFYKNLVYSLCQIYYSFASGFTGQTIFDSWVIICFNMMFTLLPPLAMGLFEYDITEHEIYKYPLLYYDLRSPVGGRLSRYSIARWISWAFIHSAIIFGFMVPTMQNDDVAEERTSGIWTHGSYVMSFVISAVLAKSALLFMSWTWIHFASIILSFVAYHLFIVTYSSLPMFLGNAAYYGIFKVMYSDPKYYLLTLVIVTLLVVLEIAVVYWAKEIDPRLVDLVRESMHMKQHGLRRSKHKAGKDLEIQDLEGDHSKPLLKGEYPPGGSNSIGSPLVALQSPPSPGLLPSRRDERKSLRAARDDEHTQDSSLGSPTNPFRVNFAQLNSSQCSASPAMSLRSGSPSQSSFQLKKNKPALMSSPLLGGPALDTTRLVSQISLLEYLDEELEKNGKTSGRGSDAPPRAPRGEKVICMDDL
eukprot:TRINITY_DN3151_c6_g1_i1.p1 TRINITY_DN3151_c6_g1~~TRINITY_DN3151_c6_g1_i1.p1  ORF type:complete len:1296 (+),score=157.47 TRINITY_DN3151_c6_g1_i1:115-4002(+)